MIIFYFIDILYNSYFEEFYVKVLYWNILKLSSPLKIIYLSIVRLIKIRILIKFPLMIAICIVSKNAFNKPLLFGFYSL